MKDNIVYNLIGLAIALPVLFLIWQLFNFALDRNEIAECIQLEQQSVEYGDKFFLAEWQRQMCESHDFQIREFKPNYESQ